MNTSGSVEFLTKFYKKGTWIVDPWGIQKLHSVYFEYLYGDITILLFFSGVKIEQNINSETY